MSAAAAMSPTVPKPAHVSDCLVYDFDAYRDPGLLTDPAVRIAQMVKEAPPRMRNIRLDPRHPPRFHGGHVIGPESMAVIWDV